MRVNIEKLGRFDFTRREMLKTAGGAFVLGAAVGVPRMSYGQEGAPAAGAIDPNVFLRIGTDNSVTLLILVLFQDETNSATLPSWQDLE
jgi:hypothetical protein